MESDAKASFELEDDSLSAGLDAIAAKFSAIAGQINSQFANANVQLTRTGTAARNIGAAAPISAALGRGLALAAGAARMVAVSLGSIVTVATRLAPWVKYLPDSAGKWAPKVKEVAREYVEVAAKISLAVKSAKALTGQLTVLGAAFAVMELREVGASRAMAVFGAAGALALSKTISGTRGAIAAVSRLGSVLQASARGAGGMARGITSSFARSAGTVGMMLSPLAGLAFALGPVGAAAVGVAAGFAGVKRSIHDAADAQGLQSSFITLLGTADAARKRMAEITKFSSTTPFQIPGVARASRVLEVLTHGAMNTGDGLRIVGDAAAVTQQPIEELAIHIGRLYDGLQHGRETGEAMRRMQELGLISSNTRTQIENLQKEGKKGAAVWSVAAKDLSRFSGEMERQSGTWNGMLSNVGDAVGDIFRAFGAPVITALTPFMQRMIAWLGTVTVWAGKAGSIFAGWSALIAQIFADGQMGKALYLAGKVGFLQAVNYLLGALVGVGNMFWSIFGGIARGFVAVLAACTTGDFWKGLGSALKSAGEALLALMLEGAAKILDALKSVPGIGAKAEAGAKKARDAAEKFGAAAVRDGSAAGANLAPLMSQLEASFKSTMGGLGAQFKEGQQSAGDMLDVSGATNDLASFIHPIAARAKDAVDAAARAAERGGLPPPIETLATTPGKKTNDVASLQRIGGGGGFSISKADPLLVATEKQTGAVENNGKKLDKIAGLLTKNGSNGAPVPVFGPGS